MKINFEDKSYIESRKLDNGNIVIIISAQDQENIRKKITNAVELTEEEFQKLMGSLLRN
jgi:hypothetical protein